MSTPSLSSDDAPQAPRRQRGAVTRGKLITVCPLPSTGQERDALSLPLSRRAAYLLCVGMLQHVLDRVLAAVDLLGVCVRDLNGKLVLKGHDHLDGVERIEAEVVHEMRLVGDLWQTGVERGL